MKKSKCEKTRQSKIKELEMWLDGWFKGALNVLDIYSSKYYVYDPKTLRAEFEKKTSKLARLEHDENN